MVLFHWNQNYVSNSRRNFCVYRDQKVFSLKQKYSASNEIPGWIKSNTGWWADGKIDDSSFIQ